MDDVDYSTGLLLASLLSDNTSNDVMDHTTTKLPTTSSAIQIASHGSTVQQSAIPKPFSSCKASAPFDSLEELINATLSPSEENYPLVNATTDANKATPVSVGSVGLPPKFRNTFKPVELTDAAVSMEDFETVLSSPSYVVASAGGNASGLVTTTSIFSSMSTRDRTINSCSDLSLPPSKKWRSESHPLLPRDATKSLSSGINSVTSLPISGNTYSNLLARSDGSGRAINSHHPVVTTTGALNGVHTSASNTSTATSNTVDLKRLQEANLVSDLQAASNKPISSASILHAIQVVQLNYSMLLQKLNQNIDDATAEEVKSKLMVLTHHYKQLAQQYQAKLLAEKSSSKSPVSTTCTTTASVTNAELASSNVTVSSVTAPFSSAAVIDLTNDKSFKTTTVNTPAVTTSSGAANVSSYLQSIPSLAAYLLQNTEAQKQLTALELQQLNQIRVNLLQEFQRRQVQNFLTSLPADTRPKNVNELKDMMKEKKFSIQIPPFLVSQVVKPSTVPLASGTQYKQEVKIDPMMTAISDNKQRQTGQQQSVMATLLPHSMVNSVKSEEKSPSHLQSAATLPIDIKPLTSTSQGHQLFVGDMLQHLHNAGAAKLATPIKREDNVTKSTAALANSQSGTAQMRNSVHKSFSVNPPPYSFISRSKIMAQNITRNIPGTSFFSSKAAKYRAMAGSTSSILNASSVQSASNSSAHSSTFSSSILSSTMSTHRSLYNTRAQLRTQRLIEEQKRLEEERIKQLSYTPEQLKTISNIKYFMQADHSRVTKVDTQTPFHSKQDAFQRLSAYHVYYEPEPSDAVENRVEQMHDILARELMKKSRGLMAKYNHLLIRDEQEQLPKHIDLANERLFVEEELCEEQHPPRNASAGAAGISRLDDTTMSKVSSFSSQLIHDINVLQYTNTAGSVGIT